MTTPHSLILAELQRYRGGEFVPSTFNKRLEHRLSGGFYWNIRGAGWIDCEDHDAHVHIELAAIKMLHRAGEVWMPKSLTPDALLATVRGINAKEN